MDFPFGDRVNVTTHFYFVRFNPCSIGFSFRSKRQAGINHFTKIVSILVLLDFPFGVTRKPLKILFSPTFQSLFYWIFLSENTISLSTYPQGKGFNPCSIGFSFRSRRNYPLRPCCSEFQSLFYWIFLSEHIRIGQFLIMINCFNPCSIGFSFRRPYRNGRSLGARNVSILVLLDFPFGDGRSMLEAARKE